MVNVSLSLEEEKKVKLCGCFSNWFDEETTTLLKNKEDKKHFRNRWVSNKSCVDENYFNTKVIIEENVRENCERSQSEETLNHITKRLQKVLDLKIELFFNICYWKKNC